MSKDTDRPSTGDQPDRKLKESSEDSGQPATMAINRNAQGLRANDIARGKIHGRSRTANMRSSTPTAAQQTDARSSATPFRLFPPTVIDDPLFWSIHLSIGLQERRDGIVNEWRSANMDERMLLRQTIANLRKTIHEVLKPRPKQRRSQPRNRSAQRSRATKIRELESDADSDDAAILRQPDLAERRNRRAHAMQARHQPSQPRI